MPLKVNLRFFWNESGFFLTSTSPNLTDDVDFGGYNYIQVKQTEEMPRISDLKKRKCATTYK